MKKIGILTYHNNGNRGAILQGYCLAVSIKGKLNQEKIEITDYRTLGKEIKRLIGADITRHTPKIFLRKITNYNTCTKFLKKENMLSSNKIITNSHKKAIQFLKNKDYGMIVVGSDQVWTKEERNTTLPTNRPFPNAYYLDPSLKCLKVSYAASANGVDYHSLSESQIETYRKHLSAFDKISVRDQHTEELLVKIGVSEVNRVPDPTLLMDLPDSDLKDVLIDVGISLEKPIVGIYQCGKMSKKIADHYREKGYQVVALYKSQKADFELFTKIDPLEYYSVHRYLDFVVSGSLHSTIFSIKNGTPFVTLDYSDSNLIDKKETLLEEFSLLDRHINISSEEDFEDVIERIEKCEKELNEGDINRRLDKMKEKGLNYIEELGDMLDEKD